MALVVAYAAAPSRAHDWYPYECCNDDDCAPVLESRRADLGSVTIMTTRHGRVAVPDSFPRRISPDNRTHLCIMHTPPGPIPRCLFVPGTS